MRYALSRGVVSEVNSHLPDICRCNSLAASGKIFTTLLSVALADGANLRGLPPVRVNYGMQNMRRKLRKAKYWLLKSGQQVCSFRSVKIIDFCAIIPENVWHPVVSWKNKETQVTRELSPQDKRLSGKYASMLQ